MMKRTVKLRSMPDVTALAAVLLVILFIYMVAVVEKFYWFREYADTSFSMIRHTVSLPGANREDAMIVYIHRDGTIVFGNERLRGDQLSLRIKAGLRAGAEKKVYIRADARAYYGNVHEALDAVRAAGIDDVSFITGYASGPFSPTSD